MLSFRCPCTQIAGTFFSFTHDAQKLAWTRLPQGCVSSPSEYNTALKQVLDQWSPLHPNTVLLQYIDDLLICSDTKDICSRETVSLLLFLYNSNNKVSKDKLQYCQEKVIFLGHCISHGIRHLTPDRVKTLQNFEKPRNVRQLRAFLGLVGYCRDWIPNASELMAPLYEATTRNPFKLTWDNELQMKELIKILSEAPAIGLPDYTKTFSLFCHEVNGFAAGVLTQLHGDKQRPVMYVSASLDPVIKGSPSCMRAIAACILLLDKVTELVLDSALILYVPHAVQEIMNQVNTRHVSASRFDKYQSALFAPSNLTIKRCVTLNPATLLPIIVEEDATNGPDVEPESFSHDCMALMEVERASVTPAKDEPLSDCDTHLFVDGSRFYTDDGQPHTGFAVTTTDTILHQEALKPQMSAQEAELYAVVKACHLLENQRGNVYTDSRYAFGIAHDFGPIWKARNFLTSAGKPVRHAKLIERLFEAFQKPAEVAILKVKGHARGSDVTARGNALADQAAKDAALMAFGVTSTVGVAQVAGTDSPHQEQWDVETLIQLQNQAPDEEKDKWIKCNATQNQQGLWSADNRWCLPRSLYPVLAQLAHGVSHLAKGAMVALTDCYWIAPGFSAFAARFCASCLTCALYNAGRPVHVPQRHSPKPDFPFQRIQIDYIQMPRIGTYEFALVCVDMFSGWPESWPVAKANAKTTAKKILNEIVCRYGVPETIESDRGTHFTGEVMKEVMEALHIQQAFHTPYHPQSSGKVERLNGILKNRCAKIKADTGKGWVEALPLALYSVRTTPKQPHGLSPYEILFGGPPKTGLYFPQQLQASHSNLLEYVQILQRTLNKIHEGVYKSIPDPDSVSGIHRIQPGDWVVVKRHVRKPLEPKFDGPHLVLLTTGSAVKLEGKPTWIHASHCKKILK